MSCFFVTGTDTNVGKTISSRAIIQVLQQNNIQIVGYKPIACSDRDSLYGFSMEERSDYGQEDNSDVLTLMASTKESVSYQDINSYSFEHTMPILTEDNKRVQIEKIDTQLKKLKEKYQTVLVEGTFGWQTPMNNQIRFSQWAKEHNMPVILVVGIKEGCINHALLSAQSIIQSGLPLLGWVANRVNPCVGHYAELIELLTREINAPLLGKIPYVHKPENQDLGKFITNIEPLLSIIKK